MLHKWCDKIKFLAYFSLILLPGQLTMTGTCTFMSRHQAPPSFSPRHNNLQKLNAWNGLTFELFHATRSKNVATTPQTKFWKYDHLITKANCTWQAFHKDCNFSLKFSHENIFCCKFAFQLHTIRIRQTWTLLWAGAKQNTPKIAENKWMSSAKNTAIIKLAKYSVCKLIHVYSWGWRGIIPC